MPRHLTLLRHAKSDWSDSTLRDFDRPLNKRGNRDAPAMGKLLKEKGLIPDLIISSDAARARSTAAQVALAIGYAADKIIYKHAMYLAAPSTLIQTAIDNSGTANHIMLVAHNPGMTDLANRLSDARLDNLPTCGVFTVTTDSADWQSLLSQANTFKAFYCPKQDLD